MIFEMGDEIKYYKPMIIELNKIFQIANILLIRHRGALAKFKRVESTLTS